MGPRRSGRHRSSVRGGPSPSAGRRRTLLVSAALLVLALAAGVGWAIHGSDDPGRRDQAQSGRPTASSPTVNSPAVSSPAVSTPVVTSTVPTPTTSVRAPSSDPDGNGRPTRPAVRTPGGMWWGVDSSGPITAAAIANVKHWYRGGRPQFWGRYLNGSYGVTRHELAFARSRGIYVALLVTDSNCSQCAGGGDICGNDETGGQAQADARQALSEARKVGVPAGALLIKDTEQISSCRGEPSADYLLTWYRTVHRSGYRTGFYGNVHGQDYDFPRDYCAARARNHQFATDVVLDMDENEPRLGAPQGTTGPHNAPAFRPQTPDCAPRSATEIWQYGESIDADNYADIDQARPDTAGLLAPDSTVTGS